MVDRYVGSGKAAELLGFDDRSVRRLRERGHFPKHEVEIEETNRVIVGWRPETIEALRHHLADPDKHPAPTPSGPSKRYLGMTAVASRYGFTRARGYQRLRAGDFPPHAVELEQPRRTFLGWAEATVADYEPRMNRLPGRPRSRGHRGGVGLAGAGPAPGRAGEAGTLRGEPADR